MTRVSSAQAAFPRRPPLASESVVASSEGQLGWERVEWTSVSRNNGPGRLEQSAVSSLSARSPPGRGGVGGLEAAKREVESEARVFRQMEMRAQVSGMLLDLHVMFLRCVGLGRLNALGYLGVFGR